MRVLCAPDSFKGTLDAAAAAEAMALGVRDADAQPDCCPIADGGEGTLDVLVKAGGGRIVTAPTIDPIGRRIEARIGFLDDQGLAIIEMAEASGLGRLVSAERKPLETSSFGTGHLMAIAAREADRILVGVGGTATVDGGCGLLQALGTRLLDDIGAPIESPMTGGRLIHIGSIEPARATVTIEVAVDVEVPLLGPTGAAAMFGPQKGADPQDVELLEAGLLHLADCLDPTGTMRLTPGAGAAGGAGFGLHAALGGSLKSGIHLILDAVEFESRVALANLVLVGEGRLDAQSSHGKALLETAHRAARLGVPVIAICGDVKDVADLSILRGGPLHETVSMSAEFGGTASMRSPASCLQRAAAKAVLDFQSNRLK